MVFMPTFHFHVDARVEVEATDTEAATEALEAALDRGEPQTLLGAMFHLQQTDDEGRPRRERRYGLEEIKRMMAEELGRPLDCVTPR